MESPRGAENLAHFLKNMLALALPVKHNPFWLNSIAIDYNQQITLKFICIISLNMEITLLLSVRTPKEANDNS